MGVEATESLRWFERLLGELGMEMWVGDPVKVRAAAARKAKTDKRDAELLLRSVIGEPVSADLDANGGSA